MFSLLMMLAAAPAAAPLSQPYRPLYAELQRFQQEQARLYPDLQVRVVTWPRQSGVALDGLVLSLRSHSVARSLPYQLFGGVDLPLDAVAEREDAVVSVNRPAASLGLSLQYAVAIRPDGRYPLARLRAACEQGLQKVKSFSVGHRLRLASQHCAGLVMRFQTQPAVVSLHPVALPPRPLAAVTRRLFGLPVQEVTLRFASLPAAGEVRTGAAPEVIDFIFE
ncbi:hypothetical protein [Massilia sp. TS11]|uniref:hypothetical protein n=1 Tax=Massilia sp. TS11 TaxID=2908003 RepID=UPI001EDBCC8C|nr:hypothetical protein [Massilia sp. TS11]MCG2585000.1 hypothetical protein [Massilia sp. TS11]